MPILKQWKKKLSLRQRILLLFLGIVLFALMIAGLTVQDRLGLNFFQRHFTYDNQDSSISFSHGSRSANLFSNLDYRLLSCSDTLLQLFSPTGDSLLKETIAFSAPALSSNGKQAVVYDVGGRDFYVLAKEKIVYHESLPEGQYLLSATINQSGWMALTTKVAGYKGVVHIYDASYKPLLSINLSSSYPVNALVTPDCKGVYVLSSGQSQGIFESRVLYYDLTQAEEPNTQISLGNNVILSMKGSNNRCWVLGENELFILASSAEMAAKYPYGGKYLKRASLDGTDFAAMLLSSSPSGNSGTLLTVDAEGVVMGSVEIDEQVLALSAAGRYVAILTPSCLRIYTKDLAEIHVSEAGQGVQNLVLYPDSSLALITDQLARLYLP